MAFAGCTKATDDGDRLTVSFSYWANYKDDVLFRAIVEDFERKNPDIRVDREWYPGDYGRKLQLSLISQTAADIILMDDETYPAYAIRGYLEDLGPYIERDEEELQLAEFLPTSIDSFNFRGYQGGIPWGGSVFLIFYNKGLFDEAGLPYPTEDWTWQEFRETAKALTRDIDGDGRLDQYGFNVWLSFLEVEPIIWSHGGDILNAERTRSAINSPEAREALRLLYDMRMEDRSIAWSGALEGFYNEAQILTGKVAMLVAGSYMIPTLDRAEDAAMSWDVAPMPFGPRGDRYTRVTWDGISINAHTTPEKKEAAWRFIRHFLSPEMQALIGKSKRLPVREPQVQSSYIDPATPVQEQIVLEATYYGRLTPITPRYLELRDAMASEFDLLNIADVFPEHRRPTPEKALAAIEPKINRVLSKELADWAEANAPVQNGIYGWGAVVRALGLALLIVGAVATLVFLVPPSRRGFLRSIYDARDIMRHRNSRLEALEGILFASPWLVGLLAFTAFPIVFSIVLSFCDWNPYDPIEKIRFLGLGNFERAFSTDPVTGDPLVLKGLYNTFYYAAFAVPLGICTSLGLALLLNQRIRGITVFRTTFYLPSIVSGVATVVLWTYIFNPVIGPLNSALRALNRFFDATGVLAFITLPEPLWLSDPVYTKPAMIIMALWGAGGAGMLIFLAGLQGVPDMLYEVAELDGAGRWRKFWNITLPMLTPTIYFNLVMGTIGALKVFMQAYVMTGGTGGVDKSLLFYVLHLYNKAFVEFEMGYASALAWILFLIILAFTMLVIRSSALWVYYEGERRR